MKYSIIIPAYNEEARIGDTVRDYAAYILEQFPEGEAELRVIVNGSKDRTADIARELEREYPCVRAWVTPERQGKGGAVMKGFEQALGEIVAFADADNATTAPEMRRLLDVVAQDAADAAIGSRWLPQSRQAIPQPLARRVASRVFNLIVRLLFQFPYQDTQCGAKAFRKAAIDTVRDEIHTTGWAFDVALIWRLRRHGFKVLEVPITWSDNSKSRLRMHRDAPSMLWELIKLRLEG
ncbi:MAG: dolichyl-phosphate beta-glucosyltransferase [bacterium]